MKNTIFNIFTRIATFIKAHAVISITTGAIVLTTAVVTPVAIQVFKDESIDKPYTESSIPELDEKFEEQAKQEQEEGLPSQADQEVAEEKAREEAEAKAQAEAEKKAKEEAAAKAEAEKKAQEEAAAAAKSETEKKSETTTSTSSQETPKKEETNTSSTPTTNTTNNNPTNESENKNNNTTSSQVVQTANTTTGISWDGKSPITYTYTDGSKGITPKDGATYEVVPGLTATYNAPKIETNNVVAGVCPHCGKKEGDGTNGTCLRFWSFDDNCPCCGSVVPVNTCHTCG